MPDVAPAVPPESSDLAPPRKLRRISRKTRDPALPPRASTDERVGRLWQGIVQQTFSEALQRRKYRLVYDRFEHWFACRPTVQFPDGCVCSHELWQLAVKDWSTLSKLQKNQVLHHFIMITEAPVFIKDFAASQWQLRTEQKPKIILQASTVLLTYQGPWGLLTTPLGVTATSSEEQMVEHLRTMSCVLNLWQDFTAFSEDLADKLHAPFWACCLEICSKTWQKEQMLRLHGHLFLKCQTGKLRCQDQKCLRFRDSSPHQSDTLWGKKTARSNWAGAYYVLSPKSSSILRKGSVEPFLDFPVNPEWVFNMIEAGKISYEDARRELITCGKGLTRRLPDVDCWHRNKQELQLRDRVSNVQAGVRARLKSFPRWPTVDAWLTEVSQPFMSRKRCLVLQGPSRLGKTEFVRGLFPVGSVLELNAAGLTSICLHGFDPLVHRCLLWDEASPKLVADNRKVFQHPACWLDLGHSPTGQHVVQVFLNDCCSILTSNSWHMDVRKLPHDAAAWLDQNVVVFDVTKPLWEASSSSSLPEGADSLN